MTSDGGTRMASPSQEIEELRQKLKDAEDTLKAIRSGSVDALVVKGHKGEEEIRTILDIGSLGDSLFNQFAQPIFILDKSYRILRSNKKAQDLCGLNPVNVLFSELFSLLPTIETGLPVEGGLSSDWIGDRRHISALDVVHYNPDLGTRFYLVDASPVVLSWEGVQGGIVSMMDITERKLAEIRLSVKAGQLRQQFTFMKSISDNIAEGLLLLDEDHKVIFQNPSALRLLGLADIDLPGRDLSEVFHIESEDGARLEFPWLALVTGDAPDATTQRGWVKGAGGVRTPVQYSLYSVKDGEDIRGSILVISDISERISSDKQLRLSVEKQQQSQKMEAIGRLAGGIAHDFNNLLLVIMGFTDLTLQGIEDDAAYENLMEVRKAGEKAAALTAQLLAYSRKQMLAPKVRLVNDSVVDLQKMLSRLIGENIRLDLDLTPEPLSVEVDEAKLQQVLVNMILNSKDAMSEGGDLSIRTGSLDVKAQDTTGMVGELIKENEEGVPPGKYAFIEIKDTGHGMSEDVLSQLFEPFFTTKEFGKGSGLGLSTAYGIIRQLGGYIQVFSLPGAGSTFKVILPLSGNAPEPSEARVVTPISGVAGADKVVLLVEDEDVVRKLLTRVLQDNGYRVIEARNGKEALTVLPPGSSAVDLVITDLMMPVMGGIELAERLGRERPELTIMFMSGYSEDKYNLPPIRGEAPNFAAKPFAPADFLAKIQSILESKTPAA
ncbi:MAG: hybrid sensor histidine kinase/response regulator [Fibrobacteres bacterium]|nr:hybrid sensor histidine kinase/response regulator [Fibrobacterota bacterium]